MLQVSTLGSSGAVPEMKDGAELVTNSQAINALGTLKDNWPGLAAQDQTPIAPPDQGLCVGNGFVLETVNLVCPHPL